VKLKTTIDVTAAPELTAKAADQVVMAPCRPEVSVLEAKGSAAPGVSESQANVFEVGAGASHGSPMTMVWDLPKVVGSSWTLLRSVKVLRLRRLLIVRLSCHKEVSDSRTEVVQM
jgi:hypothetical protein